MERGFTLVELLAVIIILGVLAVLVIPKIQESIYNAQDQAYNLIVSRIEDKATDYITDNNMASQITPTTPLDVYVSTLVSEGYMEDKDLADPRASGKSIDKTSSYVRFTLVNGSIASEPFFTIN